ncbi:hypothetical protein BGX34_011830, partial [Mortierella sp. NVP85]
PLVEFYTMRIRAEASYIIHRFAAVHVIPDAMNAFPLVHLMEAFDHAKSKLERTVNQLRQRIQYLLDAFKKRRQIVYGSVRQSSSSPIFPIIQSSDNFVMDKAICLKY